MCLSDTGGQAGVDIVSHLCMVSGYCIIVSHAVDIEEVSPIACDIVLHHVKVVGLSCWLLL